MTWTETMLARDDWARWLPTVPAAALAALRRDLETRATTVSDSNRAELYWAAEQAVRDEMVRRFEAGALALGREQDAQVVPGSNGEEAPQEP